MIKMNKIWAGITAFLSLAVGVLWGLLSFKSKRLKDTKKQNEDLKRYTKEQNIAMDAMQKAKKQTEGKIEKMETGNASSDFGASVELLHNSAKRGL